MPFFSFNQFSAKYLPCLSFLEDVYTLGLCTSWLEVKPSVIRGPWNLSTIWTMIKQWTDIFRQCYSFLSCPLYCSPWFPLPGPLLCDKQLSSDYVLQKDPLKLSHTLISKAPSSPEMPHFIWQPSCYLTYHLPSYKEDDILTAVLRWRRGFQTFGGHGCRAWLLGGRTPDLRIVLTVTLWKHCCFLMFSKPVNSKQCNFLQQCHNTLLSKKPR